MSNTEEVKIQAESLLKILEETKIDGIVKRFYDASKTKVIPTIREMQTSYQYDQSLYMNRTTARSLILTVLGHTDDYDSFDKILNDNYNDDTLIEDDVFCFAAQQHLVDLADSNGDENEIFEIKRFLIRHTMYAEALEGSPYDLALTDIEEKLQENPSYFGEDVFNPTFRPAGLKAFKGGIAPVSGNSILSVPKEPEELDLIDEKYIDCEFVPQESKSYQKPKLYQGCLFVSKYKTIKEIFAVDTFDEHIITDTNGNAHEIKDCYPIFITEKPEVGDIAFVPKRSKFYMVANKDVLKAIKDSGFGATYYTLKYNNRKIEVLKVKRFSCGTLDKDISEVPYHVNIEYIDQDLTYDVKKIADHYNIATTRIIAKEKELIECYEMWNLYGGKIIDLGVVFLENAYRILKENGRMGIVLSNSIASIDSHKEARKWLMERMRIVAIFDLPANVFGETGVNTSVIVAYKPKESELEKLKKTNYQVFFKGIDKVGYEVKTSKRVKFFSPIYKVNYETFETVIDNEGCVVLDEEFSETIHDFKEWCKGQEDSLKKLFLEKE